MEFLDDDQSWSTPSHRWIDPIEAFIDAFTYFTDGLLSANLDDLERAIAVARASAIAQYNEGNQLDGQS